MRVAFIHPDLGIGGAEQLVVNLCLGLIKHGHHPAIYTPYHHQSFPPTHDGTIPVHQHGTFFGILPDTIFTHFKGLLAYLRCLLCALWVIVYAGEQYQLAVADQVSAVLPLFKLAGFKTVFYCHYPDKLLAHKGGVFKTLYRFFIDLIEELSLLFADKIYVNSQFTSRVFDDNFTLLRSLNIQKEVLYPSIDFSEFNQEILENEEVRSLKEDLRNQKYLFSLNRYERKKGIGLAISAFAEVIEKFKIDDVWLVIAGGYDLRLKENVEYKLELEQLVNQLGLTQRVRFYTSISNPTRQYLLRNAQAVIYTPQNEHFGIVPVEAMYLNVPVIADCSGGPKESVDEGCGLLCTSRQSWSLNINKVLQNGKQNYQLGHQRVLDRFSFDHFAHQFTSGLARLVNPNPAN